MDVKNWKIQIVTSSRLVTLLIERDCWFLCQLLVPRRLSDDYKVARGAWWEGGKERSSLRPKSRSCT